MNEIHTRTFALDRKAGEDNVFPAVATTEAPVFRGDYYEVLDMSRADLSRAPLPFIESHDTQKVNIGIAENVRTDGDKLRCDVRLGNSARASELAEDIRSGIVTGLSIGYRIDDAIDDGERDGTPVYRFAFEPMELSAVSVPADINAGFFRTGKNTMETQDKLSRSERKRANVVDELGRTEEDRVRCIQSMAKAHEVESLGMEAIAEKWTVEEFNEKALSVISHRNANARQEHYAGMPADNSQWGNAIQGYSVLNALRIAADRDKPTRSLEAEISDEMKRAQGMENSNSIIVPYEALQQRAVTAGGSGANLIGTDHLAGSFIDVLRNRSQVMQLNPTILNGLVGDVAIPRQTASTTAYWIAGDNSDSLTESDPTMDQVTLSPNFVGGVTTISRKMLAQSSPGIEGMVRSDLAKMVAVEIDAKAIAGDGTSNTPTGVLNQTGINTLDLAATDPSYAEIVSMETKIADDNALGTSMAYLTTPTIVEALKTTPKQGSGVEGNFIWEMSQSGEGRINGYPCLSTKNVPASYLLLGDWSQLFIGMWGGIELDADPYGSNFLKGSISVRVLAQMDFALRHPEAFCIASENVTP